MAGIRFSVKLTIEDARVIEDFMRAGTLLEAAIEELPWRDDLREAAELLANIGRGLRFKRDDVPRTGDR